MKAYKLLLSIIIVLINTGCAFMFNTKTEKVTFNSKPKGMSVLINDSLYGKTPFFIELSKRKNYGIKYKYKDSVFFNDSILSKNDTQYMALDLLFPTNVFLYTIPLPFIIDALTGSYKNLNKSYIYYNHFTKDSNNNDPFYIDYEDFVKNKYLKDVNLYQKNFLKKMELISIYQWKVYLNDGKSIEKLKLIDIGNNMLEIDASKFSDTVNLKDTLIKRITNSRYLIPVDKIIMIEYIDEMTSAKRLQNTLKGALYGLGISSYVLNLSSLSKMAVILSYYYVLPPSLVIGALIGLSIDNSEIQTYDFRNMNMNKKISIIKNEILWNDE